MVCHETDRKFPFVDINNADNKISALLRNSDSNRQSSCVTRLRQSTYHYGHLESQPQRPNRLNTLADSEAAISLHAQNARRRARVHSSRAVRPFQR